LIIVLIPVSDAKKLCAACVEFLQLKSKQRLLTSHICNRRLVSHSVQASWNSESFVLASLPSNSFHRSVPADQRRAPSGSPVALPLLHICGFGFTAKERSGPRDAGRPALTHAVKNVCHRLPDRLQRDELRAPDGQKRQSFVLRWLTHIHAYMRREYIGRSRRVRTCDC